MVAHGLVAVPAECGIPLSVDLAVLLLQKDIDRVFGDRAPGILVHRRAC
jgi:hypothetical protein